jgi:hypothetical protein
VASAEGRVGTSFHDGDGGNIGRWLAARAPPQGRPGPTDGDGAWPVSSIEIVAVARALTTSWTPAPSVDDQAHLTNAKEQSG